MLNAAVINFLGSNCLFETIDALEALNYRVDVLNQNETDLKKYSLIVLPGGFSYGDYINAGRMAKFSPSICALKEKIKQKNSFVLGICNGFQILCEAGILPGALIENINQKFICKDIEIIFNNKTFFLPIAHQSGRYYIDDIKKLKDFDLIKYKINPNGSTDSICGLWDKKNNIMGLMPHPERNLITPLKSKNGKIIFDFIREKLDEIKQF